MNEISRFRKIYGNNVNNKILEYLLENQDIDFAVGTMCEELEISKPRSYEIIQEFEKKKYILKSRIVSKTQLYRLNKENEDVKIFLRNFNECLKIVINEYQTVSPAKTSKNINSPKKALIRVSFGPESKWGDVKKIIEKHTDTLDSDTEIFWEARVDNELKDQVLFLYLILNTLNKANNLMKYERDTLENTYKKLLINLEQEFQDKKKSSNKKILV